MACNEYCPNEANPFDQDQRSAGALRRRVGVKSSGRKIEAMLDSVPKPIVAGDSTAGPVTVRHGACASANMAASRLFEGLTIMSGSPYYSRVVHLHTGMPSLTREHAAAFIENLAGLGRQEIVFAHDDCYVMAAVLAPGYGIEVPFRAVHLAEWLGRVLAEKMVRLENWIKK